MKIETSGTFRAALLAVLGSLPGCSDEAPAPSQTGSTAAPVASTPLALDLEVTADGAPLPFRSARAFTRGGRGIDVVFSTAADLPCTDIEKRRRPPGEKRLRIRLNRQYQGETGELRWRAFSTQEHAGSLMHVRQVEVRGADARTNGRVSASIDLGFAGMQSVVGAGSVDVKGRFDARGCGDFPPAYIHDASPQTLSVQIGGETFAMKDARVLEEHGRRRVVLASQPIDCNRRRGPLDVGLAIDLDDTGRVGKGLSAYGDLFDATTTVSSSDASVVTLTDVKEANGRWTAEARATETFGGARVILEGRIDAMICPAGAR